MKCMTEFSNSLFLYTLVLLLSITIKASPHKYHHSFLQCLSQRLPNNSNAVGNLFHTRNDPSYLSILNSAIMNPRLVASPNQTPKPLAIVTPSHSSEAQTTVRCAKKHGVQIRTRSGGHDSEGLSYLSRDNPYVVLDLRNLRSVHVDVKTKTAWVQAGATLGELYYSIANKSATLGFPAGICYAVGIGGHFSGGGYGLLLRKYGLASDNILDAVIVDVDGRVLDRDSMGEDLFWAIRGGGAASFGVVLAWKIRLVDVPSKLTMFNVVRDLDDPATKKLVHRWQEKADKLDGDLLFFFRVQTVNSTTTEGKQNPKLQILFMSVFLGGQRELYSTMQEKFPELGLTRHDVVEVTWMESILFHNGFPSGSPPEVLLDRYKPQGRPMSFMAKSDYVEKPVSEEVLERLWERLYEDDVGVGNFQLFPYGARMSEIPESETPFPHRAGFLYELTYLVRWDEKGDLEATERHLNWTRSAYSFMTPYVSKNPRGAYLNYRDLDLGRDSDDGFTSSWGRSYFKGNFERLVRVKTKVDPSNFFRDEQSIPPLMGSENSNQAGGMVCTFEDETIYKFV